MRRLARVGMLLGMAYCGYLVLLYVTQRELMYPGTRTDASRPFEVPEGAAEIHVVTSYGRLPAWWFAPPGDSASTAIIVAHGNADLIHDDVTYARALNELGAGVLLLEYPGFGGAPGTPSRASIAEAFRQGFDALSTRYDVAQENIVGIGRSLGGGAITDLATARPLRAVILQSTFSSMAAVASGSYFAPSFLVRDDFDNVANLGEWMGPVLILHGRRDRTLPFRHAEELSAVRDGIHLLPLDCGHNDCNRSTEQRMSLLHSFLAGLGLVPPRPGERGTVFEGKGGVDSASAGPHLKH